MGQNTSNNKGGGFSFLTSFGGFGFGTQQTNAQNDSNVNQFGIQKAPPKITPFGFNHEKLVETDRSAFDVSMEDAENPVDRSTFVNRPRPHHYPPSNPFAPTPSANPFAPTPSSNPFSSTSSRSSRSQQTHSKPNHSTPRSNPFNSTYDDRRSTILEPPNRRQTFDFATSRKRKPNSPRRQTFDFPNTISREKPKPSPFAAFSNPKQLNSAFSSKTRSRPFHYSDAQRPRSQPFAPPTRRRRKPFQPHNHVENPFNFTTSNPDIFRNTPPPPQPSRPNPLSRNHTKSVPLKRERRNHFCAPSEDDDLPGTEKRSRSEESKKRKKKKLAPSKRYRNVKRTREDPDKRFYKKQRPNSDQGKKRRQPSEPENPLLRKKRVRKEERQKETRWPKNEPAKKRGREGPMPLRKKRVHVEKKTEILQHLAKYRKKPANPSAEPPTIPTKSLRTKKEERPRDAKPERPPNPSVPKKRKKVPKRPSVPRAKPKIAVEKKPKPKKPTIAEAANERLRQLKQKEKEEERSARRKEIEKEKVAKEINNIKRTFKYDPLGLLRYLYPEGKLSLRPKKKEVSKAYRKALKQYHPDRSQKLPLDKIVSCEEKFKLLNEFKDKILSCSRY